LEERKIIETKKVFIGEEKLLIIERKQIGKNGGTPSSYPIAIIKSLPYSFFPSPTN
jgi:hypothetical protein